MSSLMISQPQPHCRTVEELDKRCHATGCAPCLGTDKLLTVLYGENYVPRLGRSTESIMAKLPPKQRLKGKLPGLKAKSPTMLLEVGLDDLMSLN